MNAQHALRRLKHLANSRKSVRLSKVAAALDGPFAPIFIGLLSFPFLFFISIPGLSAIFGIIIAVNGVRIAEQKRIYLPKFLGKIKISTSLLQKAGRLLSKYFLPHPKRRKKTLSKIKTPLFISWLSGWIICFSGILLALPLPPGTSIPSAVVLILVSVGLYRQVVGWVIAGGLIFVVSTGGLILFLGWSAEKIYQDWPQLIQHL